MTEDGEFNTLEDARQFMKEIRSYALSELAFVGKESHALHVIQGHTSEIALSSIASKIGTFLLHSGDKSLK